MKTGSFMALVASVSVAASAFGLNIGDKAPSTSVKMKNVVGSEVSIADVTGKEGTLVIFSCNHCPFVKAWQDRIASIGNAAKGKGVGVIVINSNDPASYPEDSFTEMQARAKQLGFTFPYVVDATSGVARSFDATRTPEAFRNLSTIDRAPQPLWAQHDAGPPGSKDIAPFCCWGSSFRGSAPGCR